MKTRQKSQTKEKPQKTNQGRHVVTHSGTLMLECLHCKATLEPPLPLAIDIYLAMGRAFFRIHKKCLAQEVDSSEGERQSA